MKKMKEKVKKEQQEKKDKKKIMRKKLEEQKEKKRLAKIQAVKDSAAQKEKLRSFADLQKEKLSELEQTLEGTIKSTKVDSEKEKKDRKKREEKQKANINAQITEEKFKKSEPVIVHLSPKLVNEQKIEIDSKAPVVHYDIICDVCEQGPIIGTRFKCFQCADYDLCEKCEKTNHKEHLMLRICTPENLHNQMNGNHGELVLDMNVDMNRPNCPRQPRDFNRCQNSRGNKWMEMAGQMVGTDFAQKCKIGGFFAPLAHLNEELKDIEKLKDLKGACNSLKKEKTEKKDNTKVVEVGPIWSHNDYLSRKDKEWINAQPGWELTGHWWTTIPGSMSVVQYRKNAETEIYHEKEAQIIKETELPEEIIFKNIDIEQNEGALKVETMNGNELFKGLNSLISEDNGKEIVMNIKNESDIKVLLFWIDFEKKRHLYQTINGEGTESKQQTYVNHQWVLIGRTGPIYSFKFREMEGKNVQITISKDLKVTIDPIVEEVQSEKPKVIEESETITEEKSEENTQPESIITNILKSFTNITQEGDKNKFEQECKEQFKEKQNHINILNEVMTVPGKFGELLKGIGSIFGNIKEHHESEMLKKKEEEEKLAQEEAELLKNAEEEKLLVESENNEEISQNLEESVFKKSEDACPSDELTDIQKFKIAQLEELGFHTSSVLIVVKSNPDMCLEELVELVLSNM